MTGKSGDDYLVKMKKRLAEFSTQVVADEKQQQQEKVNKFTADAPKLTLDDVILSAQTKLQIEEGMAKIRFHKIIYEDWNFGSIDRQGKTVILNFFGPPGTGKTLTAEAFAGSLNMPILKLGIAEVESKFMGETSKNIQAVFQSAKESGSVIFFDEADTLLGKRLSSVTQGIDNEVNSMRSTLLIELEKFDGVVIFATNFAKNYDEAFRSRISHHIHFNLPAFDERKQIWNQMIVEQIPLQEERGVLIDEITKLSEGFSGREIRTCLRLVLPKALLEADSSGSEAKVKLEHFKSVIDQINLAKKEVASCNTRPSSEAEVGATKSLLGLS